MRLGNYDQDKGPAPTPGVWDFEDTDEADDENLSSEELLAQGNAIIESGDVDRLIEWGLATVRRARAQGRPDIAARAQSIVKNLAEKQGIFLEAHERLKQLLSE